LLFVVCVGSRDLFSALVKGETVLADSAGSISAKAEQLVASVLGQHLPKSNPYRESVAVYLNCAGSEAGYNFFAPHVPGSYRLVFELHYQDGRVEYETPHGDAAGSEVRLATLLDLIGHFDNRIVREGLIRLLAQDSWRQHQNLTRIRTVFGLVNFPTVDEYAKGISESYRVLYGYDFTPQAQSLTAVKP
jgi:hypothetical protein